MAYEHKSYENIKKDIKGLIGGIDTREGSFTDVLISPLAYELYLAYNEFDTLLGTMFLDYAEGYYLELRGNEYGIYKKQGVKAMLDVTFTSEKEIVIPSGTLLKNDIMNFKTNEEVISNNNGVTVRATAVEIGSSGNIPKNSLVIDINNISITNTPGTNGTDSESDEELRKRIITRIKNPPASGNKTDYERWALEVDGIGKTKCYPLGVRGDVKGKVDIYILDSNFELPSKELIASVNDYIYKVKPIGATIEVLSPKKKEINITGNIMIEVGHTFEEAKEKARTVIDKYLKEIALTNYTSVQFGKIFTLLFDTDEIKNIENFKINNSTSSINIDRDEIPVINNIDFVEVSYESN